MADSHRTSKTEPPFRLEFKRMIAEGGFAQVWLAQNHKGRRYAVKVSDRHHSFTEIKANEALTHRNIARYHYWYSFETKIYLVFDFVDGPTLLDILQERDFHPLEEHLVKEILEQLLSALQHCHKNGIFHRDLKLENIMMTNSGKIKLLDFGLAAIGDQSSLFSEWVGSPDYAAPELFERIPYSGSRADIFSLGVVLFALATGVLPFSKEARECQINDYRLHPFLKFPKKPQLSIELQDLIQRMMEFTPKKRLDIFEIKRHCWMKKSFFDNFRRSPTKELCRKSSPMQDGNKK